MKISIKNILKRFLVEYVKSFDDLTYSTNINKNFDVMVTNVTPEEITFKLLFFKNEYEKLFGISTLESDLLIIELPSGMLMDDVAQLGYEYEEDKDKGTILQTLTRLVKPLNQTEVDLIKLISQYARSLGIMKKDTLLLMSEYSNEAISFTILNGEDTDTFNDIEQLHCIMSPLSGELHVASTDTTFNVKTVEEADTVEEIYELLVMSQKTESSNPLIKLDSLLRVLFYKLPFPKLINDSSFIFSDFTDVEKANKLSVAIVHGNIKNICMLDLTEYTVTLPNYQLRLKNLPDAKNVVNEIRKILFELNFNFE